jgi:hypothetical protein
MTDGDNYKVGYGRPPKATQFKKGQNGNRKRPLKKDKPDFAELIDQMLDRKVHVVLEGKPQWLTMKQVIVKWQVHALAKGDVTALNLLLKLKEHAKKRGENPPIIVKYVGRDGVIRD